MPARSQSPRQKVDPMQSVSKFTRIAIAAALAIAAIEAIAAPVHLGTLDDLSASFDNTVVGAFTDTWTFHLSVPSLVAASLTNVEIGFGPLVAAGGISGLEAALDGSLLAMIATSSSSTLSLPFGPVVVTTTTQLLTGGFLLPAGSYELVVAGTGVTSRSASYGGNIVATAVAAPAQIPEPGSHGMVATALAIMGLLAARRRAGA